MTRRGSRRCGWLHSVTTAALSAAALPGRISVWITPSQRPARFQLAAQRASDDPRYVRMAEPAVLHLLGRSLRAPSERTRTRALRHPALSGSLLPRYTVHSEPEGREVSSQL
ncbi:hypothetical protein EYF80_014446 [Liparis tanakae]|uniref:Uncharacterized protein n=1 Tax=Liparis tanakae TaxID=230148 RepID=A0A4Z2IBE3_9TELE|nr:hypothetical protein EYF80_014446 [Liparis tanakae]